MSGIAYMDPDRLREVSSEAESVADNLKWEADGVSRAIQLYELEDADNGAVALMQEIAEELGILSAVATRKAYEIQVTANGGYAGNDAFAYQRLEDSLNDGFGSDGLADPDAAAASRAEVEAWLKENPNCDADMIAAEMDKYAETGDVEALTLLAEAVWRRVDELPTDEATTFLRQLRPRAFMVAVELAIPPATEVVAGVMMEMQVEFMSSGGAVVDNLGAFLFQKYGIFGSTNRSEWAAEALWKMAQRGAAEAKVVLTVARDWKVNDYQEMSAGAPPMANVLRRIARAFPEAMAHVLDNRKWSQRILDTMVIGASDGEVESLYLHFTKWAAANFEAYGGSADLGKAIGMFYRTMSNAGHGMGYDWAALADGTVLWMDVATGGLPIASSVLALSKGIVPDDTYKKAGEGDARENDERNAALAILWHTNPLAAQVLIQNLGASNANPGAITEDRWSDLPVESDAIRPPETEHVKYCENVAEDELPCIPTLAQAKTQLDALVEVIDGAWD